MIRKRISLKLGVAIILLVITILLPLAYSMHQFFGRFYMEQTISALVSNCEYIEQLIREREGMDFPKESVVFLNSLGSELILVDDEYKVAFNTGVPFLKVGDPLEKDWFIDLPNEHFFHYEKKEWIIVGMPILESEFKGIVLYTPKEPILQATNQFQRMILLAGLGAILLAIGLTWVLSRRMVHPLLTMKETTKSLSRGDFTVKIPTTGKDEIAQLGESINQLADDLHRLQTSRREFLSNVSHELRTPLSYVKGYSQALEEGMLKTEEDQKRYIKVIHREANRLSRLVEDLFDLTQMDEGQLRLSDDKVDVNDLIQKMIHTTEPRAQAKHITLHDQLTESLPVLQGDYGRLSQVLFNLLDNAIRHTTQGGKVVVSTTLDQDHVKIMVQDTGSGISESELPYISERFYRVDKSRSRGMGGTGLGLAIVKQIVEGHQGSVQIDSKEGVGTKVTVILPTIKGEKKRR
jgi:signal transduction histidine kinase